jgi:hypothetical protein
MIFRSAVKGHGQDARNGGFADAAMATEDVAVGGSSLLYGILKRPGDVLLTDNLGELLRTVFAGQDGVTHEGEASIIRDGRLMRDETKITKTGDPEVGQKWIIRSVGAVN